MKKRVKWWGLIFLAVIGIFFLYLFIAIRIPAPEVNEAFYDTVVIKKGEGQLRTYKNNWLRKAKNGLWEMYVEGTPFERGVIMGKLSKPLVVKQEENFIASLRKMVPGEAYINFLKYFVAWFNRDLDESIPEEYKEEIYGVSRSASSEFDYIGPKYNRILNYHAAHDIGHFLQELHLVPGCTSFGVWDGKTKDSSLIVGRNFDFYVGDAFAKDKIVAFIRPDKGNKFMMLTWGGMIGAVSGMNDKGLTVTINAARAKIPFSSATPVSIVAREVLQYADNIQEAYAIIAKRKTFVAQSFLIGSAADNKAVVIEKTPKAVAILKPDTNYIFCANHFKTSKLKNDKYNLEQFEETSTGYRYRRMRDLVEADKTIGPEQAAAILRDTKGNKGQKIGYGNERALNQLQGHHSIIFKPGERLVWVSTAPWQEGKFVAYDLKKVFGEDAGLKEDKEIAIDSLEIPEDPFMHTADFKKYIAYRKLKVEVEQLTKEGKKNDTLVEAFILDNPDYYLVYKLAGKYYEKQGNIEKAIEKYQIGLTKAISWEKDSLSMAARLTELQEGK